MSEILNLMKVCLIVVTAGLPLLLPSVSLTRSTRTTVNCINIKNRLLSFWNNINGQTNRDDILYYYTSGSGGGGGGSSEANVHILIR